MPVFNLPDCRIYYIDENSAAQSVVMLIHGLGSDSSSWVYQIVDLVAAGFRVIAPDVPGFGKSSATPNSSSIADLASFLPKLCSYLGIDQVNLVGISMGGTIALQFTLDHPTRVLRLILVNTYANLDRSNWRNWPYFIRRLVAVHLLGLSTQANIVAMRIFPRPEQAELRAVLIQQILQTDPAYYRKVLRALARFDVETRLPEITCPTLIISGNQDTTVALPLQKRLEAIPKAYSLILEDAGHAAPVDQPEAFNAAVLQFLCA